MVQIQISTKKEKPAAAHAWSTDYPSEMASGFHGAPHSGISALLGPIHGEAQFAPTGKDAKVEQKNIGPITKKKVKV